MKSNKKLITERLILSPLNVSFLSEKYLNWINDEEVLRYLETKKGSSLKDLKDYLINIEKKNIYAWAILIKETQKHIGNIKIDPINREENSGEYGIMIGEKSLWGMGFGKEASEEVIRFSFEDLKLNHITLGVLSKNINAIKSYLNLGFQEYMVINKKKKIGDKYSNLIRMKLNNPYLI